MEKQPITFTDIRPGFVRTDLLKDGRNYPMLMSPQYAALRIANAIDRKKRRAIIDWRYAILVFFWRLIPEWLWEAANTELGSGMLEIYLFCFYIRFSLAPGAC